MPYFPVNVRNGGKLTLPLAVVGSVHAAGAGGGGGRHAVRAVRRRRSAPQRSCDAVYAVTGLRFLCAGLLVTFLASCCILPFESLGSSFSYYH